MRIVTFIILSIIGIGTLIFITSFLITDGSFPSLQEYLVKTEQQNASSTEVVASPSPDITRKVIISTPAGDIEAFLADTPTMLEHGLSDRLTLDPREGMLFVFSEPDTQNFWMKDMHFSIDIVWIDAEKHVTGISSNISPDTFPEVFSSEGVIQYVLEINAGEAEKHGLKKGIQLYFTI